MLEDCGASLLGVKIVSLVAGKAKIRRASYQIIPPNEFRNSIEYDVAIDCYYFYFLKKQGS